jgi:hypothetical protein
MRCGIFSPGNPPSTSRTKKTNNSSHVRQSAAFITMFPRAGLMMFSIGLMGKSVMRTVLLTRNRRIYAVRDILATQPAERHLH